MECVKSSFDNPVAYKTMRKIPQREALERNILATRMAVVQFWCLGLVLYVLYVVQSGEAVSLSEANRRIRQCCQANDIEDCGMICKYDLTEAEVSGHSGAGGVAATPTKSHLPLTDPRERPLMLGQDQSPSILRQ